MSKLLIVIDMQNDFIEGSLGSNEAVKIVDDVCNEINNFDGNIIFTKDTHQDDYLETQEGKNLPIKHCIKGTEGWNFNPKIELLRKEKNIIVFEKNSFASCDIIEYIDSLSIKENIEYIELIGLCTDICVISNALLIKAFFPEIVIKVNSKCCAGVTSESHNNAINTMKMCQIQII